MTRSLPHVLTDGVRVITGPLTEVDKYRAGRQRRKYRTDKERFIRDRAESEASTARARSLREILRLYDEAGKGGRDATRTLWEAQAVFEASDLPQRLAPAIGQLALPVATGETGAITLATIDSPPVTLVADDVPGIEHVDTGTAYYDRVAAETPVYRQLQEVAQPEDALVQFVGPRYDRSPTGWRVKFDGQVESATLEDEEFVERVASEAQIILPSSRFKVRYKRRSKRAITITHVSAAL